MRVHTRRRADSSASAGVSARLLTLHAHRINVHTSVMCVVMRYSRLLAGVVVEVVEAVAVVVEGGGGVIGVVIGGGVAAAAAAGAATAAAAAAVVVVVALGIS